MLENLFKSQDNAVVDRYFSEPRACLFQVRAQLVTEIQERTKIPGANSLCVNASRDPHRIRQGLAGRRYPNGAPLRDRKPDERDHREDEDEY